MLVFDTKNSRSDDIYSDVLTWQFRIFELSWRNCRRGWLRSYQDWAKLQSKDKRNPKSRVEEKFMDNSISFKCFDTKIYVCFYMKQT